MRTVRIGAASLAVVVGLGGCAGQQRGTTVTIKGSDTMVIMGQRWAEAYMAAHPGTVIQVTGGGSGTGIAALINGTTDVCMASRPMKNEEKQQIQSKYGRGPVEIMVAKDGLAVYLHESNPVAELGVDALKEIYSGRTTDWKDTGGRAAPITTYGRENSSGTYEYFKEHVLGGEDFAPAVQTLPGTAAVVNAVARDPNGIGYGGAAYAKGVKEVAVKPQGGGAGVLPSAENVRNGSYPLSRGLFFYLREEPEGALKEFIDYALSPAGQALVTEVGYFPVGGAEGAPADTAPGGGPG
jgi:phosphate transport system substrate-binding protein